jgi:hypothetical protein
MSARAQGIDELMEASALREAARAEGRALLGRHRSHIENMPPAQTNQLIETESSEGIGRPGQYSPRED